MPITTKSPHIIIANSLKASINAESIKIMFLRDLLLLELNQTSQGI